MSILIKGMKMPTSCNTCPMLEGDRLDGLCHAASRWLDDDEYWRWYLYPEGDVDDSRPLNCPLVEVPVPHGRLIDADVVERDLQQMSENVENSFPLLNRNDALMFERGIQFARQYVLNLATTIIEAEEGDE